jgi:hypothetical protein
LKLQMDDTVYAIADDEGERGDAVEYGELATYSPDDQTVYIARVTDPDDDVQAQVYKSTDTTFPIFTAVETEAVDVEGLEDEDEDGSDSEGDPEEDPEDVEELS